LNDADLDNLDELVALLDSPEAENLPLDTLKRAAAVLAECRIERAERRASPKQLSFQKAFFDRADATGRPCGIFVALGGNRSGKTFACGWLCFAKYLRDVAKAGDWFWCIAQNLDRSVGGQQRELWDALPRIKFGSQVWDEKIGFGQHRKIKLETQGGGRCLVEFRSADQDPSTFEQAKLTGVWIDERLPEVIFNRLLARIIDRNGFILYSDLPDAAWHIDRLIEAEPSAGVYFQRFSMNDNRPNLPAGAIEQAALRMTSEEQQMRIHGETTVMEGVIYKEYVDVVRPAVVWGEDLKRCGHLVTPFGIPEDWPKWRMIDYGGSAPTACLWTTVAPGDHIYLYREYYERKLSIAENARRIILASGTEKYARNLIDPCAYSMQPGLSETIARQYEKAGITPIHGWPVVNVMGEHSMVQKVKYRLENRTISIFTNCVNLRREFRSWKYKTDKEGQPLAADSFDDTGPCHLLDCLKGFVATCPTFEQIGCEVHVAPEYQHGDDDANWEDGGAGPRQIFVRGQWRRLRLRQGNFGVD
jgi:hypothetical protein